MKNLLKSERGAFLIVEAAIVYPIMLIMIMTLLFFSMMLTMKANMQSALEISLMYYRSSLTDTYIDFVDDIGGNNVSQTDYTRAVQPNSWGNIYSQCFNEIFAEPDQDKFKEMFFNNYRFLNFDSSATESSGYFNSGGIEVNLEAGTNFVIYRDLTATAVQTVKLPFVKGFFGMDNEIKLTAKAKIIVSDSVSIMRTTDIVDYILYKTGLGDKIDDFFGNNKVITKIRGLLGM